MPYYVRKKMVMSRTVYPLAIEDEETEIKFLLPIWFGRPLTPGLLDLKPDPYLISAEKKKEELPPIFGGRSAPWHVGEEVREILEELEPGRHGFIPINARKTHLKTEERQFYILHVTAAIRNFIVIEETRFSDGIGKVSATGGGQIVPSGPIVLRADLIKGHHFWRGGLVLSAKGDPFAFDFFCSDEFFELMTPHKKALVEFYPCILR